MVTKLFETEEYWKNYMVNWFGEELIMKWEKHVTIHPIDSSKGKINLEVYKNADLTKPTIVFSHGIAGYARVLLPFLMPLFEEGYNVVAPDLEGFGYNKRVKGDFTWDIHLENLKDTVDYARKLFQGKIYLGGASMGGPLAYATDARFNCADGLICWCLFDFADNEFIEQTSTTKKLTPYLLPFIKLASKIIGKTRCKTTNFVSYRDLTDCREFNELLKSDPQAGIKISLRGATSLVTQSKPDISHSKYDKPVLVCQPDEDKMTPSYYTKKTFQKLKSKEKKYVNFQGAHFPTDKQSYIIWVESVKAFLEDNR